MTHVDLTPSNRLRALEWRLGYGASCRQSFTDGLRRSLPRSQKSRATFEPEFWYLTPRVQDGWRCTLGPPVRAGTESARLCHELAAIRHMPFGLLAKRVNELLLRVSLLVNIDTVRVPKDKPVIEELTAGHAEGIFVI